jgi:hypothetical protein
MPLTRKQRDRKPLFCGKCGRITYADSPERQWWLVGMDYGTTVVRCPQHITEWTLRISGRGRSMASYRWKRLAKENDNYDSSMMSMEPLFLDDDI